VEQYHSGVVIQQFNQHEYETVAAQIAAGIPFDIAEIKKGAKEFYSLSAAIEKYTRIYNNILLH